MRCSPCFKPCRYGQATENGNRRGPDPKDDSRRGLTPRKEYPGKYLNKRAPGASRPCGAGSRTGDSDSRCSSRGGIAAELRSGESPSTHHAPSRLRADIPATRELRPQSLPLCESCHQTQDSGDCQKIGNERLTATSFVDNILRHHITTFRDEINRIYKTRNKETIV